MYLSTLPYLTKLLWYFSHFKFPGWLVHPQSRSFLPAVKANEHWFSFKDLPWYSSFNFSTYHPSYGCPSEMLAKLFVKDFWTDQPCYFFIKCELSIFSTHFFSCNLSGKATWTNYFLIRPLKPYFAAFFKTSGQHSTNTSNQMESSQPLPAFNSTSIITCNKSTVTDPILRCTITLINFVRLVS